MDDATLDDRCWDNPAIDLIGVRAWAGFPIRDGAGLVLGTFCEDRVHRHLGALTGGVDEIGNSLIRIGP